MSYNPNFYSNFPPRFTFQRPNFVPPPPPPPSYFMPAIRPSEISDQEFVKQFDIISSKPFKYKITPNLAINQAKEKQRNLVLTLNDIKEKVKFLNGKFDALSEEEWTLKLTEIEKLKAQINESIAHINESYLDTLKKLLAKRAAKRLRLKRVGQERKKEKENRIKELKERSRKIDENLQKIKDDINKAKQEEEEKLQADIVLKETLRKKHDTKKCISKLDALVKLYKARQNTARGRGEVVSERDAELFHNNIEKLKSLWLQKLNLYEKEESDVRAALKQDSNAQNSASKRDAEVVHNLEEWRQFLFGGKEAPQTDFHGEIGRFIAVRSQWDQYVSPKGTSLPIGWVLPDVENT